MVRYLTGKCNARQPAVSGRKGENHNTRFREHKNSLLSKSLKASSSYGILFDPRRAEMIHMETQGAVPQFRAEERLGRCEVGDGYTETVEEWVNQLVGNHRACPWTNRPGREGR